MANDQIRTAIVGVGNCASSLIQGVFYYQDVKSDGHYPGLANPLIGPYRPADIVFTAAFDVNANKVGLDLSEAIYKAPNNTIKFAEVPNLGVKVLAGPTFDGAGSKYKEKCDIVEGDPSPILDALQSTETEVLINYLPVGSQKATEWWAEMALKAKCGFVNCIPVFIASDPRWNKRFASAGLPIIGDDIKSQVGATIVHRCLTDLFY